jgi:NADH-quinone oxidoreductase subunit C
VPTDRAATLERVRAALGAVDALEVPVRDQDVCLELEPDQVRSALESLKGAGGFETCAFVTAIDRLPAEPRFEVHWGLLSVTHNDRVRLRTRVTSSEAVVPSSVDLWPGNSFLERECFDMFGVRFDGNPDLRRLLMPEEYTHHPLRKDFPHEGIEPDRLYREWDRKRREAEQEEGAGA